MGIFFSLLIIPITLGLFIFMVVYLIELNEGFMPLVMLAITPIVFLVALFCKLVTHNSRVTGEQIELAEATCMPFQGLSNISPKEFLCASGVTFESDSVKPVEKINIEREEK